MIEQTLLDVQGVRTYLFIDFLFLIVKTYVLSEDMERKTVDIRIVLLLLQNTTIFTLYHVLNIIKSNNYFKTIRFVGTF